MIVKVSSKGQIVLPVEIRRKYGISAGQRLRLLDVGGHFSLIPVMEDAIAESFGMLKGGSSMTDPLLADRAEDLEFEDRKFGPDRV
ncbi:MAG: AbrB/MazE/SpoVT family DNA-binding domain-containing protein [Coriobacteriia bacterium]